MTKKLATTVIEPTTVTCKACEVMVINGHKCHEPGCPEAWKDQTKECAECGAKFIPDTQWQKCCSDECYQAYNGW